VDFFLIMYIIKPVGLQDYWFEQVGWIQFLMMLLRIWWSEGKPDLVYSARSSPVENFSVEFVLILIQLLGEVTYCFVHTARALFSYLLDIFLFMVFNFLVCRSKWTHYCSWCCSGAADLSWGDNLPNVAHYFGGENFSDKFVLFLIQLLGEVS